MLTKKRIMQLRELTTEEEIMKLTYKDFTISEISTLISETPMTDQEKRIAVMRFNKEMTFQEIAPKSVGINKFMAYFIIPLVPNKVNELIKKYDTFLNPYFDANGNLDLDTLYNACSQAMQRTLQVEWNGIVFKQCDIDILYGLIKE